MGTAGKMARAQTAVQQAGTLAEAQSILDELIAQEEEVTDIFFTQEFAIQKLTDLLQQQDTRQPVFVGPPAPQRQPKNYLMYIGIGIGILFLTGKFKL